ncbi:hypothetical protein EC968_001660 [Mortierella alpina]|nr:hypothetical protein EC968_001660 [Mortierella alpina]
MLSSTIDPLALPEIRSLVGSYLSNRDALACSQVCKDWAKDFVRSIWHTIDFNTHKAFPELDPEIIQKYSYYILAVKNITQPAHLEALKAIKDHQLWTIGVMMYRNDQFVSDCYDLIRRHNTTLRVASIALKHTRYRTPQSFQLDALLPNTSTVPFVAPPCSKLKDLMIEKCVISRATLSTILRRCPELRLLDLWSTQVTPNDDQSVDDFQHPGVKDFVSKISDCVFTDQTLPERSRSLFIHFPNLKTFSTYGGSNERLPVLQFKEEVERWCPRLDALQTNRSSWRPMVQIMVHGFRSLEYIRFASDKLTPDVVLAMLRHKDSLRFLTAFTPTQLTVAEFFDQAQVPPVADNVPEAMWMTQSLLRKCHKLEEFWLPELAMSMEEVEKMEWGCKGLKDLRIRIEGLDTAESIDRVIGLLKAGRRENRPKGGCMDYTDREKIAVVSPSPDSTERTPAEGEQEYRQLALEERVVRHLLKLDKLRILWLGRPLARLQYLPKKDALACTQVSKDWAKDFARPIWHTVDFKVHKTFLELSADTIKKYSHYILAVKNISLQSHLDLLLGINAHQLRCIAATMNRDAQFHKDCYDLIRRHNKTLTRISLSLLFSKSKTPYTAPLDAILPDPTTLCTPSKLTHLILESHVLSRASLSTLLRGCPALTSLDLWNSQVRANEDGTLDDFRHKGIRQLVSKVQGILFSDPLLPEDRRSLLVHFPNLKVLSTYGYHPDALPITDLRDEIRRWCPRLTSLYTNNSPSPVVVQMLVQGFERLTVLHFSYDAVSAEIFLAMETHHRTLTSVTAAVPFSAFYESRGEVPGVEEDALADAGWMAQRVPQRCERLEEFWLPEHAMAMDDVEKRPWRCCGLKDLRVRIRGLDVAERIEGVIATLRVRRRTKRRTEMAKSAGPCSEGDEDEDDEDEDEDEGEDEDEDEDEDADRGQHGQQRGQQSDRMVHPQKEHFALTPLEERVLQHLLRFDRLKILWLGTAIHHL